MGTEPQFYVFNNRSYVDFYPIQFGMESCKPLHSFGPTMKQHYLFHYIVSGKGIFYDTSKQRQFHLKAGQGFLISPDTICSYEADKDDPWTYIWIEFDGLKTEHFLHQAGLSKTHPIFSQNEIPTESPVYLVMKQLLSLHRQKSATIIGHLYLFISNLIDCSLTKTTSRHNESKEFYIREAINFVERNYREPISVDDLAHVCNLNRHYFSRLFKEQMNISPQQFIIQYRLSEACELLKNTNKNLQEIAEEIGYSNQFNFSTAFKRQYQMSPNRWRKVHK
ncbi:TPA: AraC family transcriptional regulator [Streptococcus suis]|nr:AraC family transcriptional regulator [Streptococcus suis]